MSGRVARHPLLRNQMEIALVIIGSLMIAATAIPLVRADAWWIRLFDFPRMQITFVAAAALAVYVLFIRDLGIVEIIFLATLALSLIYQGYMMFPYTPLARKQVEQSVNHTEETIKGDNQGSRPRYYPDGGDESMVARAVEGARVHAFLHRPSAAGEYIRNALVFQA